jgi:hypothetical protein
MFEIAQVYDRGADGSKMVLWGVISTATAACNTVGGLYAARFFLGFVEATYFVGQ